MAFLLKNAKPGVRTTVVRYYCFSAQYLLRYLCDIEKCPSSRQRQKLRGIAGNGQGFIWPERREMPP